MPGDTTYDVDENFRLLFDGPIDWQEDVTCLPISLIAALGRCCLVEVGSDQSIISLRNLSRQTCWMWLASCWTAAKWLSRSRGRRTSPSSCVWRAVGFILAQRYSRGRLLVHKRGQITARTSVRSFALSVIAYENNALYL